MQSAVVSIIWPVPSCKFLLGSGAKELGLRPSIFVDAGAVFEVTQPIAARPYRPRATVLSTGTILAPAPISRQLRRQLLYNCIDFDQHHRANDNCDKRRRFGAYSSASFIRNASSATRWKPRLSVGFGVNWNSPFGPFRIDIARALLKEPGDDTKIIYIQRRNPILMTNFRNSRICRDCCWLQALPFRPGPSRRNCRRQIRPAAIMPVPRRCAQAYQSISTHLYAPMQQLIQQQAQGNQRYQRAA